MADNGFKVRNKVNIKPSATAGDEAGDIRVDSGDSNKLKVHNGTSETTILDSSSGAGDISYDNATSGLTATNIQAAIDELDAAIEGQDAADEISYDNTTSGLTATDVQAAIDENDSNLDTHIADTSAHGVAGDVLGTSDSQTVTNKTIDADNNTISNLAHGAEVDDPSSGVHGVTGNVLGTTDSQTVTNKTIDADNNTISNLAHGAEVDNPSSGVHGVTGNVVGTSDSQTLSNKTLTSPQINQINDGSGNEQIVMSSAASAVNFIATTNAATGTGPAISADGDDANVPLSISPKGSSALNLDGLNWPTADGNDGQALTTDGSGNLSFSDVSSNGGGGILTEYIENSDAETDTTGWTVYANTSAGTQPDDFGGTPSGNVTWTRSTSSPARGTGHFVLTKDASDRQGEGVYYDFDLENGDLATVLRISMEAQELSGTYADGDVRIYVVSSSDNFSSDFNIIEPTPTELLSSSFWLKSIFRAQTDASDTDYRLCVHIASTSATAYTVGFDSISCGYAPIVYGTALTDWNSFTPTGTFTTNTTYSGVCRRVGDSVEVRVELDFAGAPNATTLSVDLPSGLTIDTSKIISTNMDGQYLGRGGALDSGTAVTPVYLQYETTSRLKVFYGDDATGFIQSGNALDATNPWTIASGDKIYVQFLVPVQGWGSTTQVSDDADTRVVAARSNATDGQTITSSDSVISFENIDYDTHGALAVSGVFTAPMSGYYEAYAQAHINSLTPTVFRVKIRKEGSIVAQSTVDPSNGEQFCKLQDVQYLEKGQTLDVVSSVNSGTPTLSTTAGFNFFTVRRISGPAQIAANENIRGRFSTTAGQSIDGSSTEIVNFDTLTYDTHSAVTTGASWEMAAPASGEYEIDAQVSYASASWTAGEIQLLMLYKNGSFYSYLDLHEATSTSSYRICLNGSDKILLDKGDTIDIRTNSGNASARSLDTSAGLNYVNFRRTGL